MKYSDYIEKMNELRTRIGDDHYSQKLLSECVDFLLAENKDDSERYESCVSELEKEVFRLESRLRSFEQQPTNYYRSSEDDDVPF